MNSYQELADIVIESGDKSAANTLMELFAFQSAKIAEIKLFKESELNPKFLEYKINQIDQAFNSLKDGSTSIQQ